MPEPANIAEIEIPSQPTCAELAAIYSVPLSDAGKALVQALDTPEVNLAMLKFGRHVSRSKVRTSLYALLKSVKSSI